MAVRLLAQDPDKRRTEVLLLLYSPVWMAVVGAVAATGAVPSLGEGGLLALGVGLAVPPWLIALIPGPGPARPLPTRYATRAVALVTVMAFLQNYFGTALFFSPKGLGMEYHFPTRLVLNRVPVFLYPLTVAYFTTYYVLLQIAWRAYRSSRRASPIGAAICLGLLSYAVAFGETLVMANDALRSCFSYADKGFVLRYGSFCYGTVFFISLPLFYRIDEDPRDRRLPLSRVLWDALAANMAILVCYEVFGAVLARLR